MHHWSIMRGLEISVTVLPGQVGQISLKGEVTGDVASRTLACAFERLFAEGVRRIVVEMAGVSEVCSTGIGLLMTALEKARKEGGDLVLVRPSPGVEGLFALMGLGTLFPVCASPEEARGILESPAVSA